MMNILKRMVQASRTLMEEVIVPMVNRSVFRIGLVLLTLFFFGALPGFAAPPPGVKSVVAIGSAAIYKDDSASAREQAIARGLEAAVERAVADMMPLQSLVGSFQTLNQTVFGRKDEFLQGFKVLAETVSGKKYRVIVQAEVSLPRITETLSQAGMAVGQGRLPRVLIAVSEQNVEDDSPLFWWEEGPAPDLLLVQDTLIGRLTATGLPVLDSKMADPGARAAISGLPAELTTEVAAKVGEAFKADVVVVGSAIAEPAANTMGEEVRTFKAMVRLQAVRAQTGEIIAETVQQAVAVNVDPVLGGQDALADAGGQAGKALARQILVSWRNQERKTRQIEVVVAGTRDLGNFVLFRRSIKNTFGVQNLQTRSMKPDQATLMVEYQGDAAALADLLMLNTFERFRINIHEVTPERIGVKLISPEPPVDAATDADPTGTAPPS
jgi:Flagellar assembly protein T, N-terminal domain